MNWKKLLALVGIIGFLILLVEITLNIETHLNFLVSFQIYMISLVIPETAIIKICWDFKSDRAKNPITKKYMKTITFIIIGAIWAIIGFFLISPFLEVLLNSFYLKYINQSFLTKFLIGVWFSISLPLLPLVMFTIASPSSIGQVINSFKND